MLTHLPNSGGISHRVLLVLVEHPWYGVSARAAKLSLVTRWSYLSQSQPGHTIVFSQNVRLNGYGAHRHSVIKLDFNTILLKTPDVQQLHRRPATPSTSSTSVCYPNTIYINFRPNPLGCSDDEENNEPHISPKPDALDGVSTR